MAHEDAVEDHGSAPIERIEIRNGLESLETWRPYEAGGIGRRIRVFRLPDENPHELVRLERRVALTDDRDYALHVCLTQEDGHLVWSTPIHIFR